MEQVLIGKSSVVVGMLYCGFLLEAFQMPLILTSSPMGDMLDAL